MTLAEVLPSLGGMLHTRLEPGVWPDGTTRTPDGDLVVGGVALSALADRFGTPLHVLDEAELLARCRDYRSALPDAEILPVGDQLVRSTRAIRCLAEEGMAIAVGSGSAAALARARGVPAPRLLAACARADDLRSALVQGCGRVAVGSTRAVRLAAGLGDGRQEVLVDVAQRRARRGGSSGVRIDYDRAMTVVRRLLAEESLRFAGLRCVLSPGSVTVPEIETVVRRLVRLITEMRDTYGVAVGELGIAGEQATGFDLLGFATRVRVALRLACAANRLRPPRLLVEPGRAFPSRAAVALRRVVAVAAGGLVVVDGPAVSGRAHHLAVVGRAGAAPGPGDVLAIPCAAVPERVPLVTVAAGSAVWDAGTERSRDDIVSAR